MVGTMVAATMRILATLEGTVGTMVATLVILATVEAPMVATLRILAALEGTVGTMVATLLILATVEAPMVATLRILATIVAIALMLIVMPTPS